MFIGGLNWDTTDGTYLSFNVVVLLLSIAPIYLETLRDYFSQFGKVDACTIMRDQAGRSRCFAFLTFEEPASVNAVMVREHFLDGKVVSLSRLGYRAYEFNCSPRLTQNAPYLVKSISVRPSYLLVDCLEV